MRRYVVPCASIVLAAALLLGDEAWGRVGGGESFGTGGGGGGGGGSSGGGGGGDGDLIGLLLWLLIRHPTIGIPVLVVVAVFWLWQKSHARSGGFVVDGGRQHHHLPPPSPRRARPVSLDTIAARDPGFSAPVLYDLLQLLHRRAVAAAPSGAWEPLLPFVAEGARKALERAHADVRSVDDVVLGGIQLEQVGADAQGQRLVVRFLESRVETTKSGAERRVYLEERWTLRRGAEAVSLAPDAVRRMGCPSCGAAIETDPMGRCKVCGTVITDGRLQWQAVDIAIVEPRRPIPAPELSLGAGGFEESARVETIVDPRLGSQTRALTGRHPDFSFREFEAWLGAVYLELQSAWSANKWEQARPHTTDPMFQSLRFWMDRYAAAGLRNALEDVRLDRVQVVKVGIDAWYESITVRIWGGMKDYTVDASGAVVAGNPRTERVFSEYWTFIRAAGAGGKPKDPHQCPSCGAALDRVSQAGVCGYCDSKITTGDFDWVLSRIDQPQVYTG